MTRIFSAREVGEELGIPHLEVIRRIRKGDIAASKVGWNYVVTADAIEAAKKSTWFVRRQARLNSQGD